MWLFLFWLYFSSTRHTGETNPSFQMFPESRIGSPANTRDQSKTSGRRIICVLQEFWDAIASRKGRASLYKIEKSNSSVSISRIIQESATTVGQDSMTTHDKVFEYTFATGRANRPLDSTGMRLD